MKKKIYSEEELKERKKKRDKETIQYCNIGIHKKNEADILEKINSLNKNEKSKYIKNLIRKDIENKKKIKDLTQEEIDEVCEKYLYCSFGKGCPFKNKATGHCMVVEEDIPYREEEVEVDG